MTTPICARVLGDCTVWTRGSVATITREGEHLQATKRREEETEKGKTDGRLDHTWSEHAIWRKSTRKD